MRSPRGFDTVLAVVLSLFWIGFFAGLGGFVGALAALGMIGLLCAVGLVQARAEKAALRQQVNDLQGLAEAMAAIIRESPDASTRAAGGRLWDTHFDALNGRGIHPA
jgi:hypothetical protein